MPHNDEVTLHAYLDGALGAPDSDEVRALEARLETDAELKERLHEIRAVRARVDEILGQSGPLEIVKPSFAEIQARADRRRMAAAGAADAADSRPRRGRRPRRFPIPLAWAATITVAVGAGWIARSVTGEFETGTPQIALQSLETTPAPGETEAITDEPALLQEALAPASTAVGGDPGATNVPEESAARNNEGAESVGREAKTEPVDGRFDNGFVVADAIEGAPDVAPTAEAPAVESPLARRQLADADDAFAEAVRAEAAMAEGAPVDHRVAGAEREADEARDELARNRAAAPAAPEAPAAPAAMKSAARLLGASWHAMPGVGGRTETTTSAAGCYVTEDAGGLSGLPARFELTDELEPVADGTRVGRIPEGQSDEGRLAWTEFGPDSVWISWSDGPRGVTLRLGRVEGGLEGQGRGSFPIEPWDDPSRSGFVHVVRMACED